MLEGTDYLHSPFEILDVLSLSRREACLATEECNTTVIGHAKAMACHSHNIQYCKNTLPEIY